MGYNFAYDLGAAVAGHSGLQSLRLRDAIRQHIYYNFVPSLPGSMIEPCAQAIEAYMEGDYDRIIETPFQHRIYGNEVPASALVEACRLHGFVDAICIQTGVPE